MASASPLRWRKLHSKRMLALILLHDFAGGNLHCRHLLALAVGIEKLFRRLGYLGLVLRLRFGIDLHVVNFLLQGQLAFDS